MNNINTSRFELRRVHVLIFAGIIVVCSATSTVIATNSFFGSHESAGANPVIQSSTASDSMVTVRAIDATFSGTESVVRLQVIGAGERSDNWIPSANSLILDGFSKGSVASQVLDPQHVLLSLPPMNASAASLRIEIHQFTNSALRGESPLAGSWIIDLDAPSRDNLASILRVQEFPVSPVGQDQVFGFGAAARPRAVHDPAQHRHRRARQHLRGGP